MVPARGVMVESWEARAFTPYGLAAVRQAARDDRPWLLLVVDDFLAGSIDADSFRLTDQFRRGWRAP